MGQGAGRFNKSFQKGHPYTSLPPSQNLARPISEGFYARRIDEFPLMAAQQPIDIIWPLKSLKHMVSQKYAFTYLWASTSVCTQRNIDLTVIAQVLL